ncbi:MAG: YneF family protein [Erysipelotrichaceae bacterium]|nr:YneF family protein [Erysipelotrichaceae bacterium]
MTIEIWVFVLSLVGVLLVGGIAGFFIARWWFQKQIKENPPINEKMIRAMFASMGRPASEKQIREIMRNVNSQK